MKKGIASRCLCVALASAMVFGDVGIASAAESNQDQTKEKEIVSVVADEGTAEIAAATPYADYFKVSNSYGEVSISVGAHAYKAELYVNGKRLDTREPNYDGSYIGFYDTFVPVADTTYTVELRLYNSDGKVVKLQKKVTSDTVKFNKYVNDGEPGFKATCNYGTTDDKGIRKPDGIGLTAYMDNDSNVNFTYEVYRSTKAKGGYKRLYSASTTSDSNIYYYDDTAKVGHRYYYKILLLKGKDEFGTKNKVLASTPAISILYGTPECSLSVYTYGSDNGKKNAAYLSMYSELANSYDIYRSTNEKKGYKKIATAYANSYTDNHVKRGTVYYYKAVPRYFESKTGKTYKGEATDPVAVKFIMNTAMPVSLTQVGKKALKCEWTTDNSADVSYEVWCKRSDVIGDAFVKKAVTKKSSCILRNLASDGTYDVRIRTVKKAGSKIRYASSSISSRTMGYTKSLQDFSNMTIKSVSDKNRTKVVVYNKLSWYKDWGASGYVVTAYNNYTGKTETIKKITSARTTSYTFRNVSTKSQGIKYSSVKVSPYRGKTVGEGSSYYEETLPSVDRVKVTKKSGTAAKISWRAVSGATSYTVVRTTPYGTFNILGTTKGTSFVDTHVTYGVEYTYSVSASTDMDSIYTGNAGGYKTYVQTLARPDITSASNSAKGKAVIKWKKSPNALSYRVYRSTSARGKYVQVGKTSKGVQVYTDKGLKKGKKYYYKVVAYTINSCGKKVRSSASPVKTIKINK